MSDLTDVTRKLVAVFAADVEGYSRLMGADEVGTLKGLTERRAILDRLIGEHRGRIANTAGDSVLAEFGSAVDAVKCAVDAQAAISEANSSLPPDRRISFRIGVHIGDVMIRAGDLFGDGVNIAARLQTLAKPGGVCISGATHEQVRKLLPISFADLGAQQVKNIHEPIRAYQLAEVAEGAPTHLGAVQTFPPLPDKPSIAVLPFQNMSGDPEQEYFTDGMVEDIITALSRFKSLFVIARNSSFTYKCKTIDIRQVGRELGVRYVLEGSVRKAGGKVRITGQLIDATTGAHLWADRFDGPLDDILELQDKVTSSVVAAIAPRLELAEINRSERKPTESLDAFDLYYRAIQSFRRFTRQGNEEALQLARQAISLDPSFAAAYGVALACYTQRHDEDWIKDDDVVEGKQYALRAVEVGADDAFALARAAHFFSLILGDPGTALVIADQAIAVNPNLAEALRIGGWASVYLGQHERAIEQFHYATRLNPLDPQIYLAEGGLAIANFLLRRFEAALSWASKSLARQKNYVSGQRYAMMSYAMLGRIADARIMLARLREAGNISMTISQARKRIAHWRQEDAELYIEACRIAGMPE
jgi:TolB-like protein/class 3 adenylate cyclase/tetratricopeptide (TPR) repeat protein